MRKIIYIYIVILAIFICVTCSANPGIYLKGMWGINKLSRVKENDFKSVFNVQQQAESMPSYELAFGYYINDNTRLELAFDYLAVAFQTCSGSYCIYDEEDNGIVYKGTHTIKRKADVYSLLLKTYIDIYQIHNAKFFIGAGLGIGQIKERLNIITNGYVYMNGISIPLETTNTCLKSKNKYNLAYSLSLGSSIKVSSDINVELIYSWKDIGRNKPGSYDGFELKANRYNGHMILAGIRFDF